MKLACKTHSQPGAGLRPKRSGPPVLTLALTLLGCTAALAQIPKVEPSPRLEELHFQLGDWESSSETVDRAGKVVRRRSFRAKVRLAHEGLMIHHLIYGEGRQEPVMRIWQFFDRYKKRLYDVSFDAVGHFEHREETANGTNLAFAFPQMQAFQDGVPRNWRKTYSEISSDGYRLVWDYSEDDGKSWVTMFRTQYRRVKE